MKMKLTSALLVAAAGFVGLGVGNQVRAQLLTYSGGDPGANSTNPRPVSNATAATFDAAASALGTENLITFEAAPVGAYSSLVVAPGVTLTGTDYTGDFSSQSILNAPISTPDSLFGYNTTVGGENFAFINGGFITFSFATPIQAFGAYLTGLQLGNETFMFSDGSTRTITIPNFGSGAQFDGFTNSGKLISGIEINTTSAAAPSGDFVGVDDVRYVESRAVPEVSTWAMMVAGFAGFGFVGYRRTAKARLSCA